MTLLRMWLLVGGSVDGHVCVHIWAVLIGLGELSNKEAMCKVRREHFGGRWVRGGKRGVDMIIVHCTHI